MLTGKYTHNHRVRGNGASFGGLEDFRSEGHERRSLAPRVDAGGYRERRRVELSDQADRAAARASEAGKEIELEPMTPSERKVVHDHLAERAGIETFSEGDEPDRCVIVAPLVGSDDEG